MKLRDVFKLVEGDIIEIYDPTGQLRGMAQVVKIGVRSVIFSNLPENTSIGDTIIKVGHVDLEPKHRPARHIRRDG